MMAWGLPAHHAAAAPAAETVAPLQSDPAPLKSNPQLILTKSVEDGVSEVQVGDVIRYRIRWECSSLTTSCGEMEITDVLQSGLTYLPPPNSSVPGGFEINYNSGTRAISITKTDNDLLDGTQYDAVIAVRVNQDLRPLPATIDNTVSGRIDPPGPVDWQDATPASAPPISVGGVSPSWELTKTRVAPIIEPTVDTEVTYQLRLCPVQPPSGGIAALTDIVLTDTLPTGAVFVSASDSGTESGGVVTWPTVPGPLYPPDCLTRFITLTYPSPPFNVGNNLTNSADVTAGYTDSNGDPCPDCFAPPTTDLTHEIDPISDVPTYSKDDAGDPVGFTGTARFILELNTNGTNYPANDVTLIDNLPPELQVVSVTSGAWSAGFDYVRAYVEYSTDSGNTWTAFPGQPISYNTDATYDAGLPANITNVRWRFEYDSDGDTVYTPGLPYVWEFSENPQIRVVPRAVATTDDNDDPMPAAVVDSIYTNCVQVTRTNTGGPVTDPCNNETMTVRGDYVSLRVSKSETPGTPWDEWDDPDINSFTSDTSILPGDTLRYVLTVDMTERSSAPLIDPTILDTLPDDLIFVREGDALLDGSPLPPGASVTFTRSGPNPGAGQTLLWEFSGLTVPQQALGSSLLTVEFFARIPRGQLPGTRTNDLYVVTDSLDVFCETGSQTTDAGDVDEDTDTAEAACDTTDTYVVERSAALRGEKWIRSVASGNSEVVNKDTFLPDVSCPDGGTSGLPGSSNAFTRFPCISQAYPEGALNPGQYVAPPPGDADLDDFEYNLRIFNDGNVPMLNYVLYDILPYYGDNGSGGTLSGSARESEFRPVMTDPIVFLGGAGLVDSDFTIEYNLTTNPCRPEVFNEPTGSMIPSGCNNTWATTVADWSTVRSYRIRLNSGESIAPYAEGDPTNIVRFGVPMSIPKDSPAVGTFNNDDAQSREIAWNSFSHVGSYQDLDSNIRDLLASEPRKVGITIPERFSIGNRVWRDSDNSGTINPPDDTDPGIPGVTVNLYLDANEDGSPDGAAIATTTTDSGGYYLFGNLPAGSYIVGIPASNFDEPADPLYGLRSSTGTPADPNYTNPPDSNPDSEDHGIDSSAVPPAPSTEVFSATIPLVRTEEPTSEDDLSDNDDHGPAGTRRGLNGERDDNSDLTVDFGFFGGTDVPFSIGNHVWYDDGTGGGILNDGIRQAGELPVVGARVDLYRDGNLDGNLAPSELIRWDTTDAEGFYLFDNLDPGSYYVVVAASNFDNAGDPLAGWYSSHPTGTETTGVNGGSTTADIDGDDNGVNTDFPETEGVRSGVIVLARGVDEPLGESHLSNDANTTAGFNPTAGDGPGHIGRFGETDATSNMTIDFGFIPPMSLGNRVWFDSGAGEADFRSGYNNGIQDGSEPGVANVRVELWRDTDGVPGLNTAADTFIRFTTTDANGYYLFENFQPGDNYYVHIPSSNFASGAPLRNYISSYDRTPPADNAVDMNDNGVDASNPASTGVTSQRIEMAYGTEPLTPGDETDLSASAAYGPNNRGTLGQTDSNSNLTIDFGFVRPPRSLGNYLWFDTGAGTNANNGIFDGDELPVPGARVSLYRDANNDGVPDDVNGDSLFTVDDAIAFDVTDANGYYLFDNLPPDRYIVGVDADNFTAGNPLSGYTSSTGNVDNASNNTDSRDNGVDRSDPTPAGSPYGIISTTINLTATPLSGMPTGETGSGDTSATLGFNPTAGDGPNSRGRYGETDANSDLTLDFGFVEAYALGNRVWFDTNNNSQMDAAEVGVSGVQVALYHADAGGNPTTAVIADGSPRVAVTNGDGYYLFDYLAPGDYVVVITSDNFTDGGAGDTYKALTGYWSSGTNMQADGTTAETSAPDPDLGPDGAVGGGDDDLDLDDNGTHQTGGALSGAVISQAVTLGPTGLTEPVGETDLAGGSQGNQPDGRANMTVDFGFYRVEIGNLVFTDADKNGAFNSGDAPIENAVVRLYASDGSTEIPVGSDGILGTADDAAGGTLTDASGLYLFSGLPEGSYIVSVETPAGASSTRDDFDADDNSDPDWNVDNNDNGIGVGTGEVFSDVLTMEAGGGARPDAASKPNVTADNSSGTTTDTTVDFGFVSTLFGLGNRVWFDTDNNSGIDAGEAGVDGVTVQLYASTDLSTVLSTDTTANGGYYLFDSLPAGDYVVVIPASNFAPGGVLNGYWSSATTMDAAGAINETAAPDPDNDADSDDNGTLDTSGGGFDGAVVSLPVTLGPGNDEPTGETDLEAGVGQGTEPDARANMTVDFGFYRAELGNLVYLDANGNGTFDTGDTPLAGAAVQLFASDGVTEINVGPDGALGTADDAPGGMVTAADGNYLFGNLPEGDYIVKVTPPVGYESTVDTADSSDTATPDLNIDDNDNGVGTSTGQVASNAMPLTPGSDGAESNNTVTNATGTTLNPTLDFGFVTHETIAKSIIDTSETFTSGRDVAIGEIVTYQISIDLPLGVPLTNVTATDRMDKGLAFVDCLLVEVAGADETSTVCPPAVSSVTDPGDAAGNPANPGRQVVFDIGDVTGTSGANTILIRYRAVVLDVIENQDGGDLNNDVAWAWDGGSFSASAPEVEIVEPDLSIEKTAIPTSNVALGTPIQFTLTIEHTAQSSADAFDVVVSDFLPANLEYVPCTVQYAGLAPTTPAAPAYCPGAATDLIFVWDEFPLGQTATITFMARLLDVPAANSASVSWTSLPIDPDVNTGLPIELSTYNSASTERWYDPLDEVNIYSVSSSVTITGVQTGGRGGGGRVQLPSALPATGFAPGTVTKLPEQPSEKAYAETDVWLEIPSLGATMPIVGVPLVNGDWDVSWLWKQAGWLDGTAFPGWNGNSVLTGHVYLPDGNPGPFAALSDLEWGDKIIVHAYGSVYIYEVRQNRVVSPYSVSVLAHEEDPWLTLITCKSYNEANNTYASRIAVRAALIEVQLENPRDNTSGTH